LQRTLIMPPFQHKLKTILLIFNPASRQLKHEPSP
jgi:hypothetical protein